MRSRFRIALLLSVVLLLGQLGSLAHAASHLKAGDADRLHQVCELCVAYAAVDAGVTATAWSCQTDAAGFPPVATVSLPGGGASLPPYVIRAPPNLA
jgi:hypothetical protein